MEELKQVKTLARLGEEVRSLTQQARHMNLYYAIEIGRRLSEAKEQVEYGGWGEWIKSETEFSQSTANRLMRVFREYGEDQIGIFGVAPESSALTNLSLTNALALLTAPEEEREALTEQAADMSSRELEQAIRERDEARKAAEYSEAKLKEVNAQLDTNIEALAEMSVKHTEDAGAITDLKERIKELESRPVDVAVEVDEEAVKKAAEEAKAAAEAEAAEKIKALEDKLRKAEDAAKKAADDAEKAAAKAKKAAGGLETEAAEAKKEADRLRAELSELKSRQAKAAINSDAELAAFKLLFDSVQTDVNRMHGILLKVRERGDGALSEKLQKALAALSEAVGRCAE